MTKLQATPGGPADVAIDPKLVAWPWHSGPSPAAAATSASSATGQARGARDSSKEEKDPEASGPTGPISTGMAVPPDPMLGQQWHLGNTVAGRFDLNVRGVWDPASGAAYTGSGVRVVVIDDAFDGNHADLVTPYEENIDWDFDDGDNDPFGGNTQWHGTAVAGIIGADANSFGVVGVAYDTSLVGYRIHAFDDGAFDEFLRNIRDAIRDSALNANADVVNISQGISNNLTTEFGAGINALRFDEIETSIGTAVNNGRSGLGITIVKSSGNSRAGNYDVNADDMANDTRQVIVAGVNQDGFVSDYSSYGAAILVSAFGTPQEVVTTDRVGAAGRNGTDFMTNFDGTSAATPMVAGVVALMLDANPNLGWRDIQTILAYSARHVGSAVGAAPAGDERYQWGWNGANDWNGGGLHFSNDYGYGLVDAHAAVRLAESWLPSPFAFAGGGFDAQVSLNQAVNTMDMLNVPTVIPDGNATGQTFSANTAANQVVERVTVTLTFSTTFTGDLELYVTSPDGTVSELIDDVGGNTVYNGTWTFETQAFRGEQGAGTWSVRVVDDGANDVLTVSDIVVRTYGATGINDRYIYTDEYATFAGVGGHSQALTDLNGGIADEINAAAVTSNSVINLNAGQAGTIAGRSLTIAAGTDIEHAQGGDGNDTLIGNGLQNLLRGGRGNDTLTGGAETDRVWGEDGNDRIVYNAPSDIAILDLADGGPGTDVLSIGGSGIFDFRNIPVGLYSFEELEFSAAGNSAVRLYSSQIGTAGLWSAGTIDGWLDGVSNNTLEIHVGLPGATVLGHFLTFQDWSSAEDTFRIFGSSGDDILTGAASFTTELYGGGGTDRLDGVAGDDFIDGGAGSDTARFGGRRTDYAITQVGSRTFRVTDLRPGSPFGSDTLSNVEFLHFLSEVAATPAPAPVSDSILLQGGGTVVHWSMSGGAYAGGNTVASGLPPGWTVVGSGDFNRDGLSDIALQGGGTVASWFLNAAGQYTGGAVVNTTPLPAGWSVAGTGDVNRDGVTDLVLQSGGTVVDWILNASGTYQSGNVLATGLPAGWQVMGVGDLNGDAVSDVLLQAGSTVVEWLLDTNGRYAAGNVLTTDLPFGWMVRALGDVNGDATSDVIVQGGNYVVDWIMQNGNVVAGHVVSSGLPAGWNVVGTGDYNADGTEDISLQGGGTVVDWTMQNGQYAGGNVLATGLPGGWNVVGRT